MVKEKMESIARSSAQHLRNGRARFVAPLTFELTLVGSAWMQARMGRNKGALPIYDGVESNYTPSLSLLPPVDGNTF